MAFFYKYEYTNKRKNIHPCSALLIIALNFCSHLFYSLFLLLSALALYCYHIFHFFISALLINIICSSALLTISAPWCTSLALISRRCSRHG